MALENKPEIQTWDLDPWNSDPWDSDPGENSFELVLDTACERLWEKQVRYSIRRITEMEKKLNTMERELDDFLAKSAALRNSHA